MNSKTAILLTQNTVKGKREDKRKRMESKGRLGGRSERARLRHRFHLGVQKLEHRQPQDAIECYIYCFRWETRVEVAGYKFVSVCPKHLHRQEFSKVSSRFFFEENWWGLSPDL
jgi:hypothetical protein